MLAFIIIKQKQQIQNVFMTEHDKLVESIQKKFVAESLKKSEEQKRNEIFEYGNYDSQFMNLNDQDGNLQIQKQGKSAVMSRLQVEKSLMEIYQFYSKSYFRQIQEHDAFDQIQNKKLKFQSFLLFAKHFNILKVIFSLDRITTIFKKHADYGKFLGFDNFYFLINSLSHEPETKKFFNLDSMVQTLQIETIEELEKQQFYNYLNLHSPEKYRQNFVDIFTAFECTDKPRNEKLKYNYRKFSLPELRKKAIPEQKQKKKNQKDLFIMKSNNRQMQQNIFDEAKSIVVSWQSLRAKSVNNLGKPAQIVQKKYIKADPQDLEYMGEFKSQQKPQRTKRIQKKIKQIEERQNVKNKQILSRIEQKINGKKYKLEI